MPCLVSKRESLLLAKVEVLGVVVHELRFREASSLVATKCDHKHETRTLITVSRIRLPLFGTEIVATDRRLSYTLAHALAMPSKVTYLAPLML
jgi:hypothetical protein